MFVVAENAESRCQRKDRGRADPIHKTGDPSRDVIVEANGQFDSGDGFARFAHIRSVCRWRHERLTNKAAESLKIRLKWSILDANCEPE